MSLETFSSAETLMQCGDFYRGFRLSSSVEAFFTKQTERNSAYCNYSLILEF